jgi:S1-C subfamily serine protease
MDDATNDLALLHVSEPLQVKVATFRSGPGIRVGDEVTTIGYPLGDILGQTFKATGGTLGSLTGMKNNASMYQFTAPIQADVVY